MAYKEKYMKKLIAALATLALLVGCASTPQQKNASMMQDLLNKKQSLINDGVVASIGIATSKDEQVAYDKADLNARTDIAKELETKVQSMAHSYDEEVGGQMTQHFEQVKKTIVSQTVRGATIIDTRVEVSETNEYKVYALMVMNPKLVREAFEAELQAQQADIARFKASKAYADADREFEKYEAAKAASGR